MAVVCVKRTNKQYPRPVWGSRLIFSAQPGPLQCRTDTFQTIKVVAKNQISDQFIDIYNVRLNYHRNINDEIREQRLRYFGLQNRKREISKDASDWSCTLTAEQGKTKEIWIEVV